MSFDEWYESEYGEPPDMEDECVAAMMEAWYAALEEEAAYAEYLAEQRYSLDDLIDEAAALEEFGF